MQMPGSVTLIRLCQSTEARLESLGVHRIGCTTKSRQCNIEKFQGDICLSRSHPCMNASPTIVTASLLSATASGLAIRRRSSWCTSQQDLRTRGCGRPSRRSKVWGETHVAAFLGPSLPRATRVIPGFSTKKRTASNGVGQRRHMLSQRYLP